jgi:hypothetical protein
LYDFITTQPIIHSIFLDFSFALLLIASLKRAVLGKKAKDACLQYFYTAKEINKNIFENPDRGRSGNRYAYNKNEK